MKFNFWKKDKKIPEKQEIDNRTVDRSDDSLFYDYDKVSHNQFLTNDEIKGKYFDNNQKSTYQSQYTKKYNSMKHQNMVENDVLFKKMNDDINANLNSNKNEFNNLYNRSNEMNVANKIPVKKKNFFSKKNDFCFSNNELKDSSSNYNIVENKTNKYENRVDYYSLKKDQTKLLNLDDIIEEKQHINNQNQNDNVAKNEENKFYVDKTKATDFTNRLFVDNTSSTNINTNINQEEKIDKKPETTTIPRKTIRLSFDSSSTNDYSTNNSSRANVGLQNELAVNASPNYQKTKMLNEQNARVPTTALRYLTPVDEVDEENARIKKEERRFIKFKG